MLGQRFGERNGGMRAWAATILSYRGGKLRDQAGDRPEPNLHASRSDSAYCSWLPHKGLSEVKEAVFSRNPRAAISTLPTSQGGSDNSCEAERAKKLLGFCYGEQREHTLGTQAEMTPS